MDAISLLREQVEAAYTLSGQCLEGLTPEQLHWVPAGAAHPIGATYAHVILNEDWLVHRLLQDQPLLSETTWAGQTGVSAEQPGEGAWEEWARTVRVDLTASRAFAGAVSAAIDSYLATLNADDLERQIEFPPPRPMSRSLARVLSAMLIRHHANHTGEIAAVKGLQGLRGYPF